MEMSNTMTIEATEMDRYGADDVASYPSKSWTQCVLSMTENTNATTGHEVNHPTVCHTAAADV